MKCVHLRVPLIAHCQWNRAARVEIPKILDMEVLSAWPADRLNRHKQKGAPHYGARLVWCQGGRQLSL